MNDLQRRTVRRNTRLKKEAKKAGPIGRLFRPQPLTANEIITLTLGISSFATTLLAAATADRANDLQSAVNSLRLLAEGSEEQVASMRQQVAIMQNQLNQSASQTRELASQTQALTSSAEAGARAAQAQTTATRIATEAATPSLAFDALAVDGYYVGRVTSDGRPQVTFVFKNNGNAPLFADGGYVVTSVEDSGKDSLLAPLKLSKDQRRVMPGQSIYVEAYAIDASTEELGKLFASGKGVFMSGRFGYSRISGEGQSLCFTTKLRGVLEPTVGVLSDTRSC